MIFPNSALGRQLNSKFAGLKHQFLGKLSMGRAMRVMLAGTALLSVSCSTLSSRSVSDPAPAVARLSAGGSLEDEVERLTLPLVDSGELCGVAVGVLAPDMKPQVFGYGATEQPSNRATEQPSNRATEQPSNRATEQPSNGWPTSRRYYFSNWIGVQALRECAAS